MKKLTGILCCLLALLFITGCTQAAVGSEAQAAAENKPTAAAAPSQTAPPEDAAMGSPSISDNSAEAELSAASAGSAESAQSDAASDRAVSEAEASEAEPAAISEISTEPTGSAEAEHELKLYFNDTEIPVIWEDAAAVAELQHEAASGEITVSMSMYGDWEQVGPLGRSYTRNDSQMTAVSGDIVLYSGDQIVVFYGANTWSYTKLGRMELAESEVTELLSQGDITLTIRY